jgi:chromosome segregation ATPase
VATLDDGIANLQQFIASLVTATSVLEGVTKHLNDTTHDLAQIESQAGERGDELNRELQEFQSQLDSEEEEARQALTTLGHEAEEAQRISTEADHRLEQAATHFEEQAHKVATDLEHDQTELTSQGFTPLDHTLEETEQQLQTLGQETEHAFQELEGAVQGFQSEAQAAWDEEEGAVEHATTEAAHQEQTLVTEATEGTQAFEHEAGELEEAASTLESELETIYQSLRSGVETASQELTHAVQDAAQHAVSLVETGKQTSLDGPADALEHDALHPLEEEYQTLQASLQAAAATAAEVHPLADDLGKCHAVVGQIDQIMNALTG